MGRLYLAPLLFSAVGPPVGFFVVAPVKEAGASIFFMLPASYLFFPVACFAGVLFAGIYLVYARWPPKSQPGFISTCLMGAASGFASIQPVMLLLPGRNHVGSDAHLLVTAAVSAGTLCAAVYAWFIDKRSRPVRRGESLAKWVRSTATLGEDGSLCGPHGHCPCCGAVISMQAAECPACNASFAAHAAWRVQAISQELEEAYACTLAGEK